MRHPVLVFYSVSGGITLEGSNRDRNQGLVYYKGRPICDDSHDIGHWDINDASVVCKMFGFSRATKSHRNCGGLGFGACAPAGTPFALSGFKCIGNETHILDCQHDTIVATNCGNNGLSDGEGLDEVAIECT